MYIIIQSYCYEQAAHEERNKKQQLQLSKMKERIESHGSDV